MRDNPTGHPLPGRWKHRFNDIHALGSELRKIGEQFVELFIGKMMDDVYEKNAVKNGTLGREIGNIRTGELFARMSFPGKLNVLGIQVHPQIAPGGHDREFAGSTTDVQHGFGPLESQLFQQGDPLAINAASSLKKQAEDMPYVNVGKRMHGVAFKRIGLSPSNSSPDGGGARNF